MKQTFRKRIYTAALALCLLLTAFVPAHAVENKDIVNDEYSVDVDIAWGEMSFVYNTEHFLWNPDTHAYDIKVEAEWTVKGNDITVTNVGTNGVKAEFTAEKKEGVDTVTVGFKATNDAQKSETTYQMELAGKSDDTTPSGTVYFDISGSISETYEELATVTVTIVAE